MPSGYDVIVAPRVWEVVRRELTNEQVVSFQAAVEELKQNPTDANPRVSCISVGHAHDISEFAMQWSDLIVIFEFVNALVVEVLAVQAYPQPGDA